MDKYQQQISTNNSNFSQKRQSRIETSSLNFLQHEKPFQYVGYKLFSAFLGVVVSDYLVTNALVYPMISNLNPKSIKDQANKKVWIRQQLARLRKTMIRYNSIVFASKVILDQYYQETLTKNEAYYHSNASTHYKIGALVGFIAYTTNIPISHFFNIKQSLKNISTGGKASIFANNFLQIQQTFRQFFSVQSLRKLITSINLGSLAGVILYRTIYFGGYEKIKNKYKHPLNQYLLAPLACSSLCLIVYPLDQIKYLQMTSHKGQSFMDIVNQQGIKLWQLSGDKVFSSIIKQTISMSFFVASQKLCTYLLSQKLNRSQ